MLECILAKTPLPNGDAKQKSFMSAACEKEIGHNMSLSKGNGIWF